MLPKDNIYNFITKYRLPVSRGDRGVKVFLQEYYEKYIKELKVALDRDEQSVLRKEAYDLILSHVQIIEDLCGDIIKCFDYYDAAKMECLYKHFNDMMNRVYHTFIQVSVRIIIFIEYEQVLKIKWNEKICFIYR